MTTATDTLLQQQCDRLYERYLEVKAEYDQLDQVLSSWKELGIIPSFYLDDQVGKPGPEEKKDEKEEKKARAPRVSLEKRMESLREAASEAGISEIDSEFAMKTWGLTRQSASRNLKLAESAGILTFVRTEGDLPTAAKFYKFTTIEAAQPEETEKKTEQPEEKAEDLVATEEAQWTGPPTMTDGTKS